MRIAIVNDMLLAIEAMRRVMLEARRDQIAWIARDGAEAVARCAEDTPDLILMDLIMPKMDGVEATRRIMAQTPCAIVVVTANVSDHTSKVFEAMGAGALDAVNTPVLERSPGDGASALLAKIETIRKLIGNGGATKFFATSPHDTVSLHRDDRLIAIGASAGGPAALAKVLGQLTPQFPAAIVVVQHVDPQFVDGLASWLNQQTRLRVRIAEEGERPRAGTALLAGRDSHLVFDATMRLAYKAEPRDSSFHPSIDVFFKSAERYWRGVIIGVVLTGMGRDGAEGLLALKRSGHHTIAQDAASSAVYGMPKAVAELQAANEILPLDKIAPRLLKLTKAAAHHHG